MNTLIIYASLHGCTRNCATEISNNLAGKTTLLNLKNNSSVNLSNYSTIIIGGSIHTGHINPVVQSFCEKNIKILKTKNIGIFLCFMDPFEKFDYYLKESFPKELLEITQVKEYFGGKLDFDKMTFFEKLFIERTTKLTKSTSKINTKAIRKFIELMNVFISSN